MWKNGHILCSMYCMLQTNHCSITILSSCNTLVYKRAVINTVETAPELTLNSLILKQNKIVWEVTLNIRQTPLQCFICRYINKTIKTGEISTFCVVFCKSWTTKPRDKEVTRLCENITTLCVGHHIACKLRRLCCRTFLTYILFSSMVGVLARSFALCKVSACTCDVMWCESEIERPLRSSL